VTGLTAEDLTRGHAEEAAVAAALTQIGWGVQFVGQRVWEAAPTLAAGVYATRHPLRQCPDLIAGHPSAGVCLIEVTHCGDPQEYELRALTLSKLAALDAWLRVAPVWWVDVGTEPWACWLHRTSWAWELASDARPPIRRNPNGSGKAFGLFPRAGDRDFFDVFNLQ
jgi:hypothetical protein